MQKQLSGASYFFSFFKVLAVIFCLLCLFACQSKTVIPPPSAQRLDSKIDNAKRLKDINYHYALALGADSFEGQAKITFLLKDNSQTLALDLQQMQISRVTINGLFLYPDYDGKQLRLPSKLLVRGYNSISLNFRGKYFQGKSFHESISGLISTIDPVDGNAYLYFQSNSDGLAGWLPLFNQPDLAARFTLQITAPKNWQIISIGTATKCPNILTTETEQCQIFSSKKQKISPNQLPFYAGPFSYWQQQGKVSLGLYVRESQAKAVNGNNWLNHTRSAINKLQQRLKVNYPYNKYDQVLITDNADLDHSILHSVSLIGADHLNDQQLVKNLARQWFGHLFDLKGENSQSLSYAIADSLAYELTDHAQQSQIFPVKDPYQKTDSLVDVRSRGIAAIKQLKLKLGDKGFYTSLKQFLQQFVTQQADIQTFSQTIEKATNKQVMPWLEEFILSHGINQVTTKLQCQQGIITQLSLEQHPDDQGKFSNQILKIGLYYADRQGLHLDKVLTGQISQMHNIIRQATDLACPNFIWPNQQNLAYIKVIPELHSLEKAKKQLGKMSDNFTALMFWQSLWQAVLDGHVSDRDYLSLVLINVPQITDPEISVLIRSQFFALKTKLIEQQNKLKVDNTVAQDTFNIMAVNALAQLSLQKAIESRNFSDLQQIWLDAYIALAQSDADLSYLASLLKRKSAISLPLLTPSQRVRVIKRLQPKTE